MTDTPIPVPTAKTSGPWWWPETPQTTLAMLLVLAVVVLAFVLAFRDPNGDMFKFMVGGLMTTGFASIIGFYFGSSAGSSAKDDTISKMLPPATNGSEEKKS